MKKPNSLPRSPLPTNNFVAVLGSVLLVAAGPLVRAQAPVKPLTEGELIQTIESIGASKSTNQPLSSRDTTRDPATPKLTPSGRDPEKDKDTLLQSKPGETIITSEEATFDNKTRTAVFTGKVFVKNPDFNMSCDKLTAYMKSQKPATAATTTDKPKAGATPRPVATPRLTSGNGTAEVNATGTKDATDEKSGGLDRAVAESNVIITRQRIDSDGKVDYDVGRGKRAVYEASTGDVTLTGKPSVQQGINETIALEESTTMVLNRNGKMKSFGGLVQVILRENSPGTSSSPHGR